MFSEKALACMYQCQMTAIKHRHFYIRFYVPFTPISDNFVTLCVDGTASHCQLMKYVMTKEKNSMRKQILDANGIGVIVLFSFFLYLCDRRRTPSPLSPTSILILSSLRNCHLNTAPRWWRWLMSWLGLMAFLCELENVDSEIWKCGNHFPLMQIRILRIFFVIHGIYVHCSLFNLVKRRIFRAAVTPPVRMIRQFPIHLAHIILH